MMRVCLAGTRSICKPNTRRRAPEAPTARVEKSNILTLGKPVNLNHFRLLRVVGKGAFGKVRIVERKDTGLTFALKYIRKEEGMFRSPAFPRHSAICSLN